MFKLPNNVFGEVPCPLLKSGECFVLNCLFKHPDRGGEQRPKEETGELGGAVSNAETPNEAEHEAKPVPRDIRILLPKALDLDIPRLTRLQSLRRLAVHFQNDATPNLAATKKEHELASEAALAEAYLAQVAEFVGDVAGEPAKDLAHIMPVHVDPSPALLPTRRSHIAHFVDAIRKVDPGNKVPVWTATNWEHSIARESSSATYQLAVRRRLFEVLHPEKVKKRHKKKLTRAQLLAELRALCIDDDKLAKFGYIMHVPEPVAKVLTARTCHRCKLHFRLEEALKRVVCSYHPGRATKNASGVRIHQCCGGAVGDTDTEPCAQAEFHVFYWLLPEEMHTAIPFRDTREWGVHPGRLEAVGIDCEMGFTTMGFELLRISAVDYFSGEEVLDILVKPKGEVLDLNTRWLGVAEIKEEAVSFESLLELLGEIFDANTIFVGHGLENDLNVMRLVHHRVVDTAILYPRLKATPTFRVSLKQLAAKYLNRVIQSGEHDSTEDSIAAIDVTKHFIQQDAANAAKRPQEQPKAEKKAKLVAGSSPGRDPASGKSESGDGTTED